MNLDVEYSEYRNYIEEFAKTIDPHDQLPLRVSGYCLRDYEIHGEIIEWMIIYLGRACPPTLRIYLIQTALKRILEKVQDSPDECGYDPNRDIYQPLKLVKVVVAVVNNLIFDLQDNAKLYEVPLPPTSINASEITKLRQPPKVSVDAIKNTRRTMEDRHVIIEDFNGFFNTQDTEPTFYYGIFDGHSGSDAATYANSHLNYNISVHPSYPSDIKKAMSAAFLVTDIEFLKKAEAENLNSGTTALCAIYRKFQKKLFVGWCGDSQALIARLGNVHQIVRKHSPEDESERKRIEDLGGVVLYWYNSYRVNGQLAVSRAIGDVMHKPFVTAEPEIAVLDLDGEEDFFVMGCDGLWDSLTEDDVALTVYKKLKENPNNYQTIASELCALAKEEGSKDNISVIVVYLKEPELIATQTWPSQITQNKQKMENLNLYESEQVAPSQQAPAAVVSMDALGNTNQDIFSNNPFGDFNNQLISDVTMAKSTEITDMVMQQQPENEFCTLTDTLLTSNLNNINNNKIINGSREIAMDSFCAVDNEQQQLSSQSDPNVLILNDDNNNSNDNFNNPDLPETDVDAIEEDDDDFQYHARDEAFGGDKEKTQMEFKETDDVTDHIKTNFGEMSSAIDNAMIGAKTLENKIFEELTLHNPDLVMSGEINPFSGNEFVDNSIHMTDNKLMEEQIEEMQQEFKQEFNQNVNNLLENVGHEIDFDTHERVAPDATNVADNVAFEPEQELISANDDKNEEEVAIQQQDEKQSQQFEQPLISDLGIIGTANAEQGIEESEGSDDEWNYIKVEGDKKVKSEFEENISEPHQNELVIESSTTTIVEGERVEDNQNAPVEVTSSVASFSDNNFNYSGFTENLGDSDNKLLKVLQQQEITKEEEINFVSEQQDLESPVIEEKANKDFEQEKEPNIEKSVDLNETENTSEFQVETEEIDDMESQLNPDAKEFIPTSPVRNEFASPPPSGFEFENGKSPILANPILSNFNDIVVSQSPRKVDALVMEDVLVPEENDFDKEASERPHEVNLMNENFQRIESPNELNAKESMQVDDKLEQEYKDDSQIFFEEEKQHGEEYQELEQSFSQYSNGFQNKIDDAMNRSFYEGRDSDILADPAKNVLNTTQPLPDDDEQQLQQQTQEFSFNDNPEESSQVDLLGAGEPNISQMESSDNFEVEKFVEEIKGVSENKYVDNGLSPTVPEFPNQVQAVEETIFATHSSMKEVQENMLETFITQTSTSSNIEIPSNVQEPIIEIPHTEIKENIPEEPIEALSKEQQPPFEASVQDSENDVQSKTEKIIEDAKIEEPKTEIIAAAVVGGVAAIAAAGTSAVIKKKSPTTTSSKPDAKKITETKAKAAPKTTESKKADVKPRTMATNVKPATTSVSKTTVSKTSTTQVKSTVPSSASATSRPKTTASVPLAKKAPLPTASKSTAANKATTSASRPASAVTASKRPVLNSATATKSTASKPITEVKTKTTTTERKPLASSAPTTRAPSKPTTLTSTKAKVNGTNATSTTSSTVKSSPATRPSTSSRLNSSAIEKSLNSPQKEKVLNKSAPSATTTRSPARPTTISSATKMAAKTDLKSPSAAATKSVNLSTVGTKKPLTIVRKPQSAEKTTTKTSTTVTKKPPVSGKTSTSSSTTKKNTTTTTTTTVVKKKVVNGDVVMEETNTTTKATNDDISALNGHATINGNGIAENSNGLHEEEGQQQSIQQTVIEPSLI